MFLFALCCIYYTVLMVRQNIGVRIKFCRYSTESNETRLYTHYFECGCADFTFHFVFNTLDSFPMYGIMSSTMLSKWAMQPVLHKMAKIWMVLACPFVPNNLSNAICQVLLGWTQSCHLCYRITATRPNESRTLITQLTFMWNEVWLHH